MISILSALNAILTLGFDLLCMPLRLLGPVWPLLFISVLAGIGFVWLFGKISNQEKIHAIRERMRAGLLGIRLYPDDFRVIARFQVAVVADTGRYLLRALVPMLILAVPFILIASQLNLRFGARPLRPGERMLLKVEVADPKAVRGDISLEAPPGVVVETPAVRIPSLHEIAWRVRGEEQGLHTLHVKAGGADLEVQVLVSDRWGKAATLRPGRDLIDVLLYPGQSPVPPDSTIAQVGVRYPPLDFSLFGVQLHWLVIFVLVSILAGFLSKNTLGVEI